MLLSKVKRIAEIDAEVAILETKIKRLKKERQELEGEVLNYFSEEGIKSMRVLEEPNTRTLYIKEAWFAKLKPGVDRETAARMLEAADFGFLIKKDFNLNSVTSVFKEAFLTKKGNVYEQEKPLPPGIDAAFLLEPTWKIASRKVSR